MNDDRKQAPTRVLLSLLPEHSPSARRARVVIDDAREEVFASRARYDAAPAKYGRDTLRECVAGALELCAAETALPLGTLLTILSVDAGLSYEDITSEHEGRTPWRRRILRECEALRASGRRALRELRA